MHPGNVILRGGANHDVTMIDWARARLGSPLEDVASWLHSLGCWEPEARRRHDTLMRMYLDARRERQDFSPSMRVDYWLASASNGLSGAIRYHLAVLSDRGAADAVRNESQRALIAWESHSGGYFGETGTSCQLPVARVQTGYIGYRIDRRHRRHSFRLHASPMERGKRCRGK